MSNMIPTCFMSKSFMLLRFMSTYIFLYNIHTVQLYWVFCQVVYVCVVYIYIMYIYHQVFCQNISLCLIDKQKRETQFSVSFWQNWTCQCIMIHGDIFWPKTWVFKTVYMKIYTKIVYTRLLCTLTELVYTYSITYTHLRTLNIGTLWSEYHIGIDTFYFRSIVSYKRKQFDRKLNITVKTYYIRYSIYCQKNAKICIKLVL